MLPGEDLIKEGIRDLQDGHETIPALLVAIGSPRLRLIGLQIPRLQYKLTRTSSV